SAGDVRIHVGERIGDPLRIAARRRRHSARPRPHGPSAGAGARRRSRLARASRCARGAAWRLAAVGSRVERADGGAQARLRGAGEGAVDRVYPVRVDLAALGQELQDEPAYRARQVWEWAARGAAGFEEMTNLPVPLRARLAERVPFSTLVVEHEALANDGTIKALFRTRDGHPVEAVLMRYRDGRRSICVSSQSGCPLTCTFCATGQMRFGRNLTASEILDQALHFRRREDVTHCVFMGMGEPFLNYEHVLAAARRLPDLGITHRRTTISTVGWLPGL